MIDIDSEYWILTVIRDDDDDVLRNVIISAIFGITLDDVQVRCSWKFPSFSEGLFY